MGAGGGTRLDARSSEIQFKTFLATQAAHREQSYKTKDPLNTDELQLWGLVGIDIVFTVQNEG